jgi:hypothetical protein
VADGTRTRDSRDHNPGLYQLSYGHRAKEIVPVARVTGGAAGKGAEGAGAMRYAPIAHERAPASEGSCSQRHQASGDAGFAWRSLMPPSGARGVRSFYERL